MVTQVVESPGIFFFAFLVLSGAKRERFFAGRVWFSKRSQGYMKIREA